MRHFVSWMCLMCLGLAAQTALAGPNKGGVLLLHLAPEIQYTSDNRTYCDQFDVKDWKNVRVQGTPDPTRAQVFYVLAAFDTTHSTRFKTVGFGLSEDLDPEKIHFENWGACAMDIMEMPSKGWPGPGTGTAVFMADTVYAGLISPVYWFSAYIYDECQIKLAEYPKQVMGAFFVDDGSPPGEDKVTSFGALGFGLEGEKPRPTPWEPDEPTKEPDTPKSNK